MKRIYKTAFNVIGIIAVIAALAVFQAPIASADSAEAEVDTSTIALGDIKAKGNVTNMMAVNVKHKGKSVVRYVKNPAKHWNPKRAKRVPFAKNYYAGVRSGKPFRLKKGKKFPDTYVGIAANMTEHDIAVRNKVKFKWQLFDVKNGIVRNRGYYNGKRWVGDCVNPKPTKKPTVHVNSLHIVKSFNRLKVRIRGRLDLRSLTSGVVAVNCSSSSASARYTANAAASIEGSVMVRAKNRRQAKIRGAKKLESKYKNSSRAKTALKGSAALALEGAAEAKCESNDEPSFDRPDVFVDAGACVAPGTTRDVNVRVHNNNPSSDSARVTFRGQSQTKSVAANSSVGFVFTNVPAGSYGGTALLVNANLSRAFQVTVEECPPPADRKPVVNIMGSPAHLYVNGNGYIWIEASDPDGDSVTVRLSASGQATVSGLVPSDIRWDGTACPSGKTCFRATVWAKSSPGDATITAVSTANGVDSDPDSVTFPVRADEF